MNLDLPPQKEMPEELAGDDYLYVETEYEKNSRLRSHRNGLYRCMFLIVTSVSFNFFIFVLIIGNTITLAAYHYDESDLQIDVLDIFNEFFTWIFFLEMILKIIGLGFYNYRQDSYNVFDAVIVIISLVDWTITRIPGIDAGSALNAFRALRLLRMLKLSKSWKALGALLSTLAKSFKDISQFSMLLFLFMYIFALLGMELFANVAIYDANEDLIVGEEAIQQHIADGLYYGFPRENYNSVWFALTTVYIVILGEDWNWVMYMWVRAYGAGSTSAEIIAIVYFIFLMIFGNIVLFSLFTAILLKNFEGGDDDEEEEEEEEEEENEDEPKKSFREKYCSSENWEAIKKGFKEAFGKKEKAPKILDEVTGERVDVAVQDGSAFESSVSKQIGEAKAPEVDKRQGNLMHYDP